MHSATTRDETTVQGLAPFLAFTAAVLAVLSVISFRNYLLFHSLAEIVFVAVAAGIFMIAWSCGPFLDGAYLSIIGISCLFVGVIQILHTLAYKGTGIFPDAGADLPTRLWIAGRYLLALSLLAATLLANRKISPTRVLLVQMAATALLLASVFLGAFPACFVEGKGLTPFKIWSEYAIASLFLASFVLMAARRRDLSPSVFKLLAPAFLLLVLSELCFTLYVDVYGLSNMIGHLLQVVAFLLIYKAIVETGLQRPFALLFLNLKRNKEALRQERDFAENLVESAQAIVMVLDREGRILRYNSRMEEISGRPLAETAGKDWFSTFLPEAYRDSAREAYRRPGGIGVRNGNVSPILTRDGRLRMIEWFERPLHAADQSDIGILSVGQDVTDRIAAEKEREELIGKLREALAQVKVLSGFIPICSWCKKIRDDRGFWSQLEAYLAEHSDAEFSHGICPDCMEKHYSSGRPSL